MLCSLEKIKKEGGAEKDGEEADIPGEDHAGISCRQMSVKNVGKKLCKVGGRI